MVCFILCLLRILHTECYLIHSLCMYIDNVEKVGRNETPATLWGADKPNPRNALEANGFQMRKVYLQRSGRNR